MVALDQLFTTALAQAGALSKEKPFDAIVVGGGTAGIISVLTLAERGLRVALVEAGPLVLLTNVLDTDLRFNRSAQRTLLGPLSASPRLPDNSAFGSLIYCLGGRGLFWTGATPRFDPADFASWPFSYSDIEPFYAWAEELFGVNLFLGRTVLAEFITRRLRVNGYQVLPGPTAIDRPGPLDDRVGGSVGNALGPLLRSEYFGGPTPQALTVCTNSFAIRIEHDEQRSTGIQAVSDSGETISLLGNAVVLACGGLESVRLALASHLPDKSGLIGRGICDHLFVRAYFPIPAEYYGRSPEQAVVYVRSSTERPFQLELHLPNDNLFGLHASNWAPARSTDYSVMLRGFAPTEARPDNCIELTQDTRRAAFTVHFSYSNADLALLQNIRDEFERVRIALAADVAQIQTMPPGASHHESGGLMAGVDPVTSVVDAFGRFHCLQNVVVVDASAWPASTPYNPHLTIAAIARRQSTALAERLKQ